MYFCVSYMSLKKLLRKPIVTKPSINLVHVLQLLERSLKMFIKTACCFPERITKKDYDSILTELQHSEKVRTTKTKYIALK